MIFKVAKGDCYSKATTIYKKFSVQKQHFSEMCKKYKFYQDEHGYWKSEYAIGNATAVSHLGQI